MFVTYPRVQILSAWASRADPAAPEPRCPQDWLTATTPTHPAKASSPAHPAKALVTSASLPDWIIRVDAASARHVRDRIRKPLGEAFLLRVVMRAESLVSDVRARDQVVLGGG